MIGGLILGLCVGGFAGAFIVALAAATDKPSPHPPARVHLYHPHDCGVNPRMYQVHVLAPGQILPIRGTITSEAFSGSNRPIQ